MVWLSDQACPLYVSQGKCFKHAHVGGDPTADQGHVGEIISLGWLGNVLVNLEELVEVAGEHPDLLAPAVALVTRTQITSRKRNETKNNNRKNSWCL